MSVDRSTVEIFRLNPTRVWPFLMPKSARRYPPYSAGAFASPKNTTTNRSTIMAITVQHGKDDITVHQNASKWHIDDRGRLHIVGDNGNTAAYNEGYWANVHQDGPRSPRITAVATLQTKGESNSGQTPLAFAADYNDERNKEWAKYTPGLSVQMTVIDAVAENFDQGGRYLLSFIKQD